MIPTDRKPETLRIAVATGRISASEETLQRVAARETPKGNVLEAARTAAVMAAKRTPDLIPHCHPLTLDGVSVDLSIEEDGIRVEATVRAVARTGVEMEALTAVSVALLTVYDMLKPLDKGLEIGGIRLVKKTGGKSHFAEKLPPDFRAAVVVTSDSTHEGRREDRAGKLILERLRLLGIEGAEYIVLPDDRHRIRAELYRLCQQGLDLVLTTGGTGLGPRDVTAEATSEVIDREIPGVAEAMRGHGQRRTPYAMLSRGIAGVRGRTVIVNFPGSFRGCEESLDALFPALLHVYPMMAGGKHV